MEDKTYRSGRRVTIYFYLLSFVSRGCIFYAKVNKIKEFFPVCLENTEFEGWGIVTDDIGEDIRSQVEISGLDLNLYIMGSNYIR